jgi:hypothetical protein
MGKARLLTVLVGEQSLMIEKVRNSVLVFCEFIIVVNGSDSDVRDQHKQRPGSGHGEDHVMNGRGWICFLGAVRQAGLQRGGSGQDKQRRRWERRRVRQSQPTRSPRAGLAAQIRRLASRRLTIFVFLVFLPDDEPMT